MLRRTRPGPPTSSSIFLLARETIEARVRDIQVAKALLDLETSSTSDLKNDVRDILISTVKEVRTLHFRCEAQQTRLVWTKQWHSMYRERRERV